MICNAYKSGYNATSTATYIAAHRMRIGHASEFESDARPMRVRCASDERNGHKSSATMTTTTSAMTATP
jgi:hypothetical protein